MSYSYTTLNTPPEQSLKGRYVLLAIVVHVLLFVGLSTSIQWKSKSPPPAIAELWSMEELENIQKNPIEKPPIATPPQIQEPPKIEDTNVNDAHIALEEARRKEAELEAQRLKLAEAEKLRQQAEKEKQQEQQQKDLLEKQRLEQEQQAEKKKQEDQQKQLEVTEKARKEAQAKAQREADAAERERIKKEQLERIQGMTGGQGSSSTGTVNQPGGSGTTPGVSSAYVGRLSATLMRAITYTGDRSANPTTSVRVDTDANGTVLNITMIRSSGNADWDKAAINAIQSISPFPKDNGKMPDTIFILKFSPKGVNL